MWRNFPPGTVFLTVVEFVYDRGDKSLEASAGWRSISLSAFRVPAVICCHKLRVAHARRAPSVHGHRATTGGIFGIPSTANFSRRPVRRRRRRSYSRLHLMCHASSDKIETERRSDPGRIYGHSVASHRVESKSCCRPYACSPELNRRS
jgi:hypothetical protein